MAQTHKSMLHLRVQQGSIFASENLGYKAPPRLEDMCDHCQRCQDELRLHKLVHVMQPSHCAQELERHFSQHFSQGQRAADFKQQQWKHLNNCETSAEQLLC